MKCLFDGYPMTKSTLYGVIIDTCPCCSRVWLDKNQLAAIIEHYISHFPKIYSSSSTEQKIKQEYFFDDLREKSKPILTNNNRCLKCSGLIKQINYLGVNIDICTNCSGIYFDKDELEKVLKAILR